MGRLAYLTHDRNSLTQSAAVVEASSVATGYSVANALSMPIAKPHRFEGCNSESYTIDAGPNTAVSVVALVNHNLTTDAIVTLNAGSVPNPDGSEFTAAPIWRRRDMFATFPEEAQVFRYWKITLEDPTNTNGFIQIGYLMVGLYTLLSVGFQYGWTFADEIVNSRVESEYGAPHVARMFSRVHMTFPFKDLSDLQMEQGLRAWIQACDGDRVPFLCIPDIDVYEGWFGRFSNETFEQTIDFRRSMTLEFVEDSHGRILV